VLARAEVPRGLREAVTARMQRLSREAVALVQAAAVLAVPGDHPLLARVAGLEPDQATGALLEALDAAVLDERAAARYGFRHILAQQTVYEELPGPRRKTLHQRALKALRAQTPSPLVQIAHHTRALGDTQAWLEQAEAAADQALTLGDQGTAATLLRDILGHPGLSVERRTRTALALSRIAVFSTDAAASMTALRRILSDPQLPAQVRGEVRLTLGLLMVNNALDGRGFRELERAVPELERVHPELAARAMVALAAAAETYTEARQWQQRAESAVRDSPDQVARAVVLARRLASMALHGDPAVWKLVRELPTNSDDPAVLRQGVRTLYNVGTAAIGLGHDERAAELLGQATDLARQVGYSNLEANEDPPS
jgi:hypothetical protein